MMMNAMIPLMGVTADPVGSYLKGRMNREQLDEFARQGEFRNALSQYGAGAAQGDQNALAQIAQYDPSMSQGLAAGHANMGYAAKDDARADERMGMAREQVRQAAVERAAAQAQQMSEQQRMEKAAEGQRISAMVQAALRQGPEAWDTLNDQIPGMADIPYNQAELAIASITGSIEGFAGPKPTSGMQEYEFAQSQGFGGSFEDWKKGPGQTGTTINNVMDGAPGLPKTSPGVVNVPNPDGQTFSQAPVSGGPQTQMPAELAGRIALAEDSIKQLPAVIEMAENGDLTGPIDWLTGLVGRGPQGSARRENKAAAEAITRMLTGAGMNVAEVEREKDLYIVGPTDNPAAAADKLRQLERRLTGLISSAREGRTGVNVDPNTGFGVPGAQEQGQAPRRLRFNPQTGELE